MNKIVKYTLVMIILLPVIKTSNAQYEDIEKQKAKIVWEIYKYLIWEDDYYIQSINVAVLNSTPEMFEALEKNKPKYWYSGVKISLEKIENPRDINLHHRHHVIYVGNENENIGQAYIKQINDKAQLFSIALFTNNWDNENSKKKVMFNLKTKNDVVSFEYNLRNTEKANLNLLPDFFKLGGENINSVENIKKLERELAEKRRENEELNKELKIKENEKNMPLLTLSSPILKRGFKYTVKTDTMLFEGVITDESDIILCLLNGNKITLSDKGQFSETILLNKGDNLITFRIVDEFANIAEESFLVSLERAVNPLGYNEENGKNIKGRYYALIIGNSDYSDQDITNLDNRPIDDAEALKDVLINQYTFESENVTFLKNATRRDIMMAFDNLRKIIGEEDNLLIFYAGHGYYENENDMGYWLPIDSEKDFTANWIYNDVIVGMIKRIKTKHTLLISDACFSGSIFSSREINTRDMEQSYANMYKLNSRHAITSGTLKTVPNKSVFFEYLLKTLKSNTQKYTSSQEIFSKFSIKIGNKTENVPQWGDIPNTGDEGGDFIFILRDKN